MKIPIFIINRDRLTTLKGMIDYLSKESRVEIIVVDNGSTYEPLLDYYKTSAFTNKAKVMLMGKNYNYKVCWEQDLVPKNDNYIITDSDLILDNIPSNWLDKMLYGLFKYPRINKIGFSLSLDNIPNSNPLKVDILSHELKFWNTRIDADFFLAPVDTTFAIYRAGYNYHFYESFRMDKPYTAIHSPWLLTKEIMTDEDRYYFKNIDKGIGSTHWSKYLMED